MSLLGQTIGNYRITRKLGEGGMGAVYLGEHPLIGKKVAIKVLLDELAGKPQIVQRFFHEAKAVNDIGHQNIVDIVDFGEQSTATGKIVYFVMELLDGESLASRLQRQGLSFDETRHILQQCCSALAASHAKKIVHRDLKPENIYLVTRGSDGNFVKLLDFGIAKLAGDGSPSTKTRTGAVIGTPAYMSPEQCEGKGRIDHRSDIYSLGVVMYELLTGRVPFSGEGLGEVLVAQLTQAPVPPSQVNPEVTPELEAIVMHALEKLPDRRFQSMQELAEALTNPTAHLLRHKLLPTPSRPPGSLYQGATVVEENAPAAVVPVTRSEPHAPSSTTLSGAAAEVSRSHRAVAPPVKRASPMIAVVSGAIVFVLGATGLLLWHRRASVATKNSTSPTKKLSVPASSAAAPAPTAATVAPRAAAAGPNDVARAPAGAPAMVTLTIQSRPAGARVKRDGRDLGPTPVVIHRQRSDHTSFPIEVSAPGYKTAHITIGTDEDTEPMVVLEKLPSTKPPHREAPTKASDAPHDAPAPDDPTALMKPGFLDK